MNCKNVKNYKKYLKSVLSLGLILVAVIAGLRAGELEYGAVESFVEIHAVIAQEYYNYGDDGELDGVPSFDNRYAFLYLDCMLRENLRGIVEFRIERGGVDITTDRCLIRWKICDLLGLNMGKFYHESFLSMKRYRPSGNKLISSYLPHELFDSVVYRDIGVELFGEQKFGKMKAGYKFSVANGAMMREYCIDEFGNVIFKESTEDTNNDKATLAVLNFWPVDFLKLSGSYFKTSTDMLLTIESYEPTGLMGLTFLVTSETKLGMTDIELSGITSELTFDRFELIGGYLFVDTTIAGAPVITMNNYLGEVSYRIFENKKSKYLDLVYRATYLESTYNGIFVAPKEEKIYHSFGTRFSPYKSFIMKAEYRKIQEYEGADIDNNGVLLQAVVEF